MFTLGDAVRKMPVPKGAPLKPKLGYASSPPAAAPGQPSAKTVVVSLRMKPAAHAALLAQAEAAEITPRSWLEKAALQLTDAHLVRRKKEHPDLRALLFQVSRAGNNINQLAHKFNALDKIGKLGQGEFQVGVEVLRDLTAVLQKALARAR